MEHVQCISVPPRAGRPLPQPVYTVRRSTRGAECRSSSLPARTLASGMPWILGSHAILFCHVMNRSFSSAHRSADVRKSQIVGYLKGGGSWLILHLGSGGMAGTGAEVEHCSQYHMELVFMPLCHKARRGRMSCRSDIQMVRWNGLCLAG